jgi:Cu+-exporting ATPase
MTMETITTFGDLDEAELLVLCAAVESRSEHPIAKAIVRAAGARSAALLDAVGEVEALTGQGLRGMVEGIDGAREVVIGNVDMMSDRGVPLPAEAMTLAEAASDAGRTAVLVAVDGVAVGGLVVSDLIKDSAAGAVARLRAMGLRTILLTGDHQGAEVLPTDKAAVIQRLQASGRRVAMVGDGINDAAALATANLGLAVVSGTDVAMKSADIILVRRSLDVIPDAILLARRTLRTIRGNLIWAFAYNVAAVPLAAFGLLNPLIAGFAMSLSSVFVVTNSMRLRRFAPHGNR